MKINEVERLAGITKGNIRFYEKEGLLQPRRNSENGYREYSEEDVAWLKKIRLLRMLDVPIDEILRLKEGELTLLDAMGRHMTQLERRQSDLAEAHRLCGRIREAQCTLDELDTETLLSHVEERQREGAKFMDVEKRDRRVKYTGPILAALVMVIFMAGIAALMVWAFLAAPEEAPPLAVLALLIAVPLVIILGVLLALWQRMKQIEGGEEDAAAQY